MRAELTGSYEDGSTASTSLEYRPTLARPRRQCQSHRLVLRACCRSALWPHEPVAAVLGADRHAARSGRPTHPRIHLFVRCGLSKGWYLRLSDHADLEHSMLPGLSPHAGAQVCPTRHLAGARRRPIIAAATLPFLTTSRSCIFRPIPRNSIRRKTSGMNSAKKSSRTMPSNPWTQCARSRSIASARRRRSRCAPFIGCTR